MALRTARGRKGELVACWPASSGWYNTFLSMSSVCRGQTEPGVWRWRGISTVPAWAKVKALNQVPGLTWFLKDWWGSCSPG